MQKNSKNNPPIWKHDDTKYPDWNPLGNVYKSAQVTLRISDRMILKFLKILKMRQPHLFQHPRASSGTIKRQIEGIARYYYIPEHDHRVIGLWIPVGRNRVSKIMHKYYDKLFEPAPKK